MTTRLYILCLLFILAGINSYAQAPGRAIDVQHYSFNLWLNDDDNNIKGKAAITVTVVKPTSAVTFDLAKKDDTGMGMTVTSVTEKGKKLRFAQTGQTLKIYTRVKAKSSHVYAISYKGIPSDGLIISTNKYGDRTFFGDNWLKRAHNWLPCVDDVADKASVEFIVTAPAHYTVVSNGLMVKESVTGQTKVTHWREMVPISTKLMVIGAANFAVDESGKPDGIPVYAYTYPQDKEVGFKSYAYAAEILPFFTKLIGPYAYKKLANVQSKTKFNGMENAGAIFYSEKSVRDHDIEELIAHEVGHQWFGDAATESGEAHVWLSEGFATYLAHYYHEHKYGVDSLRKRMRYDKYTVFAFERERQTPVVDTSIVTDYMDLLNDNSYEKGSWVLHMLRYKLGDTVFWNGIRAYYAKYMNKNANTQDFKAEMEKASGQNLEQFFKQWLYTPGHPKLRITWTNDKTNHGKSLHIEQLQAVPYHLEDLVIQNGSSIYKLDIKEKTLDMQLGPPEKEGPLVIDPDGAFLAEFELVEGK